MNVPTRADPIVDALGAKFSRALESVLDPGAEVALCDLPFHTNVGDHAILLGEIAALRRLGHRIVHAPVSLAGYDRERFAHRVGGRPILLHGGGNLGDVWPEHQLLREQIIADFPGQRIVQLPQSVSFASATALTRAREVFSAHPAFTLMVRDHPSAVIAEEQLDVRPLLTPDAALALGPLSRPCDPVHDVVLLARTDHEAVAARVVPPGVTSVDWIDAGRDRRAAALHWGAGLVDGRAPAALDGLTGRASLHAWRAHAGRHFDRGLRMLSAGRVVVTDRLHAHLIALLLGIPTVLSDNSNGKIRGFYEAWTHESGLVTMADSLSDAWRIGLELAGRDRGLAT